MSLARLISRGQSGLTAYEVSVEVHLAGGLPGFSIAGLPTATVRESKDRVRAALQTVGLPIPPRRVTVHLGPAEIPKDGGRFDLAIALGLIKAQRNLPWETDTLEFLGELALSGELRGVPGVLPAVIAAKGAGRTLVVPSDNAREAGLVAEAQVLCARHIHEVLDHLNGVMRLAPVKPSPSTGPTRPTGDLGEVRGQALAKRALLIAAAGGHNMLMIGPPGSGKSMLAQRICGLLPPLSVEARLAMASLASLAGHPPESLDSVEPPFRAPHHTISAHALVGGGARPRPGEVSLAHLGVLFLDELPEFSRTSIEALREPLETGEARISRVREQVSFPAEFQLIAAMNPCPCGYQGDGSERCICTPTRIAAYRARVSGPLLDRFDLHVEVPRVEVCELTAAGSGSISAGLRAQVAAARARQVERNGVLNARLDSESLWVALRLEPAGRRVLEQTANRWQLSARGAVRLLKTARTIADLAESDAVRARHVAEAAQLRCLDRAMAASL